MRVPAALKTGEPFDVSACAALLTFPRLYTWPCPTITWFLDSGWRWPIGFPSLKYLLLSKIGVYKPQFRKTIEDIWDDQLWASVLNQYKGAETQYAKSHHIFAGRHIGILNQMGYDIESSFQNNLGWSPSHCEELSDRTSEML